MRWILRLWNRWTAPPPQPRLPKSVWMAHYNNRNAGHFAFGADDRPEALMYAGAYGLQTGWHLVLLHEGDCTDACPFTQVQPQRRERVTA